MEDALRDTRASVLIVDDDAASIRVLARIIEPFADAHFAKEGFTALRMLKEADFDLVLLDGQMPRMSGFEVCRHIKQDQALEDIPVIFVTAMGDPDFEEIGLEIGAADFITKPIAPKIVAARVKTHLRLKLAMDALRKAATIDPLTGIANRRTLMAHLLGEWRLAQRNGESLSMLMIDIDHFKRYNDTHGHLAGDDCLRRIAEEMRQRVIRPGDLVARYGGEEFAVILPRTDRIGAQMVARELLESVRRLDMATGASGLPEHLSLSIGVCTFKRNHDPLSGREPATGRDPMAAARPEQLVAGADRALYAAKDQGRGCIVARPFDPNEAPDAEPAAPGAAGSSDSVSS